MTPERPGAPAARMWWHIPKITVLAAIGLMMLIFYVTQWNRAPAPAGKAPNAEFFNQIRDELPFRRVAGDMGRSR